MALFSSSVSVSPDSVTVKQHVQHQDSEAAKCNSSIIKFIFKNRFSCCDKIYISQRYFTYLKAMFMFNVYHRNGLNESRRHNKLACSLLHPCFRWYIAVSCYIATSGISVVGYRLKPSVGMCFTLLPSKMSLFSLSLLRFTNITVTHNRFRVTDKQTKEWKTSSHVREITAQQVLMSAWNVKT